LCQYIGRGEICPATEKGACKFSHDTQAYLEAKGEDLGLICPQFDAFGYCRYGLTCRFAKHHTGPNGEQLTNESKKESALKVKNNVSMEFIKKFRSGKMEVSRTREFKKWLDEKRAWNDQKHKDKQQPSPRIMDKEVVAVSQKEDDSMTRDSPETKVVITEKYESDQGPVLPLAPERKPIDFRGKTYLAPLTTVGNLPFRRLCKTQGVDITCGEMAFVNAMHQGNRADWSLMRRHPSEDLFGIQLAGNQPGQIAETVEVISRELEVDFIDLNLGCPVDAVTARGAGSALLDRKGKLADILAGINTVCSTPFTVKIRTGVSSKPTAHNLIPLFSTHGAGLVTLHGRSKEQRYTKLADWSYISQCTRQCHDLGIPMFGNGDVLSWEDYQKGLEAGVDGIMIGRGALIKPWIFKEIESSQTLDISATERLELVKDFARFGLEYWGSDTTGVNTTRRYLCEWLSFACRYIPVGLLEVLPQKMNERPPPFKGRNELETLMASGNAQDWVRLSEMVLGPAPESFKFIPKHKSNSYEVQG
jgi:tRNA-dihydrouridine synthase 3